MSFHFSLKNLATDDRGRALDQMIIMKAFNLRYIRGDFFGGITAGIVALPLAMAFGVQSGLGAEAGLYGAIAIGIVAALFGGTPTQVSGPTGPMTVVSSLIAAAAIDQAGGLDVGMAMVLLTFFMAGVFQIVFGLAQIGKLIQFIPYPVVSGFMSGIGLIIILLQLFPIIGHSSPARIVDIFTSIGTPLQNINAGALALGLITIAIIYLFPRVTRAVPSPLIALIFVSLIPQFISMDVPKIGNIPEGLPDLNLSVFGELNFSTFALVLTPALTLAALGSIDSLLTSVVADNLTKTRHNSNRELVGQGLGNMLSALIGGIPGAGATMRTVVNIRSGGKTPLSGMIHGVFLLIVLLGVGRYAAEIPLAVLAGILITVGIGIIDYRGLGDLAKVPKADAIVMLTVVGMTVFVDLLWAVGVGLILSALFFVKRSADRGEEASTIEPITSLPDDNHKMSEIEPAYLAKEVFIHEFHGPLFFGFSTRFQEQFNKTKDVKAVLFRMEHLTFVDQSGMYALKDVITSLRDKNAWVIFAGLRENVKDQLVKIGIIPGMVPEAHCFSKFAGASEWLVRNLKKRHTDNAEAEDLKNILEGYSQEKHN